jgi:uncharacterized membrane protein
MSDPQPHYDDLNTSMIGYAGVISCVLTLVLILVFQALYFGYEARTEQAKIDAAGVTPSSAALQVQREKLASYGWIDRDQKVVAIPITQAMEKVVAELSVPKAEDKVTDAR